MLIGYLIGSMWGAMGVAWGGLAGAFAARAFGLHYGLAKSPIRPADVSATMWRSLLASVAGGAGGYWTASGLNGQEAVVRLAAGCVAFAGLWAIGWFVIPGGRAEVSGMFALLKRVRAGKGAA